MMEIEPFTTKPSRYLVHRGGIIKIADVEVALQILVALYSCQKPISTAKYFIPSIETEQEFIVVAVAKELKK